MPKPEDCLPPYLPRFPYKDVVRIVIATLKHKPVLPADALSTGETTSLLDRNMRSLIQGNVGDPQHREQLRIWAWCHEDQIGRGRPRLSFQEGSFREQCDERGWNRETALRNVDRALTMIVLVMNRVDDG